MTVPLTSINLSACRLTSPLNLLLLSITLSIASCSTPANTPEQIIETYTDDIIRVIENRKRRAIDAFIGEEYGDEGHRSKQDIVAMANGYMFRHQSIYCFTLIDSVQVNSDDTISAVILAAFAARPISDISLLPKLNSDMYWFDITITLDSGDWKLTKASWQQAMVEDFF